MENITKEVMDDVKEVVEPEVVDTNEGFEEEDESVKIIDPKIAMVGIAGLMAAGYGAGCLIKKGICHGRVWLKKLKDESDKKKLEKLQAKALQKSDESVNETEEEVEKEA